jgi:hypothetical protein
MLFLPLYSYTGAFVKYKRYLLIDVLRWSALLKIYT